MTTRQPHLHGGRQFPPEILALIYAQLDIETRNSFVPFRNPLSRSQEQDLRAVSALGLEAIIQARKVLFQYILVGTERRAVKLLAALELDLISLGERGERVPLPGYLKHFVTGLRILVTEREMTMKAQGATGLLPRHIQSLAHALPDLEVLDVVCEDKGSWLDAKMIIELRAFTKVKDVEIEGTGWENARGVFEASKELVSLKLRGLTPGWLHNSFSRVSNLALSATFLSPPEFGHNLSTLVLWSCQLNPPDLTFLFASLAPSSLRTLTIHLLQTLPHPLCPFPFPSEEIVSAILPFAATLTSFHLVLYDRAPITRNVDRADLIDRGLLVNGVLNTGARPAAFRPADALAPTFSHSLSSLTLGGPLCLTPAFFSLLDATSQYLTLNMCADEQRGHVDGLSPTEFVAALDGAWAAQLTRVELHGMQTERPDGEPAWDWDACLDIKAKLADVSMSAGRDKRTGAIELVHDVDEPMPVRANSHPEGKRQSDKHAHGRVAKKRKGGGR